MQSYDMAELEQNPTVKQTAEHSSVNLFSELFLERKMQNLIEKP